MIDKRESSNRVVTLIMDGSDSPESRDLHCFHCGRIIANYHSDVRVIIMGEIREVSRPVDIMCRHCKIIHRLV